MAMCNQMTPLPFKKQNYYSTMTKGPCNRRVNATTITHMRGTQHARDRAVISSPVSSVCDISMTCEISGLQRARRLRLKHSSMWQCNSCRESSPKHSNDQSPQEGTAWQGSGIFHNCMAVRHATKWTAFREINNFARNFAICPLN